MTDTTLAETILRDVKRYSLTQLGPVEGGQWLHYPDVIRALTAAMDPALAERAGEVLEGVTPGPWWTEPEGTIRNDSEGNPRWDLPRIVRYNATGQSVCKAHLIGGVDPDPALANARFIAWCREGVPALLAQNAALRAERDALAVTAAGWEEMAKGNAERGAKIGNDLIARAEAAEAERDVLISQHAVMMMERDAARFDVEAAEAQIAALTARVEGLTGALSKLHHAVCGETGFAACVRLVSGKAYPWPALDDADETARAALSTTEEGHE